LSYGILIATLLATAAVAFALESPAQVLRGVLALQVEPARLLLDFTLAAGEGAALLNAALVAGFGLLLVRVAGIRLSGPTIAAFFTILGFGLFGKTPLNVVPIFLGVWISARVAGKQFRDYILIALFGTALGPVVTLLAVELALPPLVGWAVALVGGTLAGFLLPPAAIAMLRLHQGYSLYNIGVTTGFLGLFVAAVAFGSGNQLPGFLVWNESPSVVLVLFVPVLSALLVVAGLSSGIRKTSTGFLVLIQQPGRLPSDFVDIAGLGPSLFNMGVLGLLSWGYTRLVGAPVNGPVIGGMLTVMGFGAFGKHPLNVWPVVAGVVIAALVFGHPLDSPGVILAALFVTTLAPLSGAFGIHVGLIAGFVHLLIVLRSGAWHAGLSLYNNGFAGGLTAALLVAVIDWIETNRPERASDRRGSYGASGKE
jgi:hypothetical protein